MKRLIRPESLTFEEVGEVLHLAPSPRAGVEDRRTANLLAAFEKGRILPARVVYVSTSGVYGDCAGERVDEARAPAPQTDRAKRRADAERRLMAWCSTRAAALVILRVPGIYALERLPLERVRAGTPVLQAEDDVYTNHIHAEDLVATLARSLEEHAPAGIFNICDDSEMRMGDWLDLVADRACLPRPPRIARAAVAGCIAPELLSFMSESRRLDNRRMKRELGMRLLYPTVHHGLENENPVGVD